MKKKRALAASRIPDDYDAVQTGDYLLTFNDPAAQPNTMSFLVGGADAAVEMLKITKEGFYVRGIKVEQDEKEALVVYNAFREWMTWSAMTRSY
jgi:hypothetical protein